MNTSKLIILSAYLVVAVFAISEEQESYTYQKRGPAEFSLGPRYGRAKVDVPVQRSGKLQHRSNQFYLGPRYGKRSSDPQAIMSVFPQSQHRQPPCFNDNDFACDYTGVSNLYRCIERNDGPIDDIISSTS
ncbi:RYamide neuropeptides-like [Onthophagus taurus]|uniref:RYamide neuropeptides-like n=1 Tax=Onthophagus taurus TaxID=166361 RepID=UPI000C206C3C|nr:RYamide neuropeptides-like [Onthophagus taurus]